MKIKKYSLAILVLISVINLMSSVVNANSIGLTNYSPREHINIDLGWRFALGHAYDKDKDFKNGTGYFSYFAKAGYGDGAASSNFEDRTWREINLPHDWAVELPFSSSAGHSHGYKTLGNKYPETSVGWYRKTFFIPNSDFGKKISIQFDGIYRNSIVWVNGFYVGHEQSGYASSIYDITDYLNYGGKNVVAVRVDASMEEGWFYEGAGIYRHVWLNKTSKLHVVQYGTFITSELGDNQAYLTLRTTVENQASESAAFYIEQNIVEESGKEIIVKNINDLDLNSNMSSVYYSRIEISYPKLWSIESPTMYKLVTKIFSNGKIVDVYETPFGIRTVKFDPDKGFFLNGKSIKLKGTNEHQDHAGVGTAMPDALQEFRIKKLKEMGSNAIRTSHNPPTPEFLDACDRLGMLVLDENRLMGSNQEHFDLLKRMMLRDRNHPSVILWSLGNEEWAIEGNEKGARIAATMQSFAQQLDSSRNFTAACSGGWDNGIGTVVRVMGYNYIVQGDIDGHHAKFPWQCGVGTEESTTMGTRGVYETNERAGYMAPTNRMPENVGTESGWKFYAERPFLAGLFYWTGFDYRGESNPLVWPAISSQKGFVDICGFPKDIFYYLKSWWTDKPVLHISPHWNWKGKEGKEINVIVYSNCDEVELFLNKKSLGRKKLALNEHLNWNVAYEPGTLLGRGFKNGKELITEKVETSGSSAQIELISDRKKLIADDKDIAVITVKVNDNKGRFVPEAADEIFFSIEGPGRIIGVGNGDPSSHEPDRFFESVEQIPIKNLKLQVTDTNKVRPETASDYDDYNWPAAFVSSYGEYEKGKNIIIRGSFELPDFDKKTEITLYSKSLAERQDVYVNGILTGKNIARDDSNQVFILSNEILHKGKNTISYLGKPFVKRYEWDEISTDPGIIKVFNPAPQWKVKVFNGLAQVIIQSVMKEGEIKLTAASHGLVENTIKLRSQINP